MDELSLKAADQTVMDVKEIYSVPASSTAPLSLTLGSRSGDVVVYYPSNDLSKRNGDSDFASEILENVVPASLQARP